MIVTVVVAVVAAIVSCQCYTRLTCITSLGLTMVFDHLGLNPSAPQCTMNSEGQLEPSASSLVCEYAFFAFSVLVRI